MFELNGNIKRWRDEGLMDGRLKMMKRWRGVREGGMRGRRNEGSKDE